MSEVRQRTDGQVPEYPTEEPVDAFRAVIQEDERTCKSWRQTWVKKRHKVLAGAQKAAADGLGHELQKQWAFCLGLQGIAVPALSHSAGASAVQLTIESDGNGVLLCIRPDK